MIGRQNGFGVGSGSGMERIVVREPSGGQYIDCYAVRRDAASEKEFRPSQRPTTEAWKVRAWQKRVAVRSNRLRCRRKSQKEWRVVIGPNRRGRYGIGGHFWRTWESGTVDHVNGRFDRRSGPLRHFRDTIATARASQVRTIGQKSLASMQRDLFTSPVNSVAEAIGNMRPPFARQANEPHGFDVEPGIVCCCDGVATKSGLQGLRAFHSAGNDRIGVDRPIRDARDWRGRAVRVTPEGLRERKSRIACERSRRGASGETVEAKIAGEG
jgi:hypothetical protein